MSDRIEFATDFLATGYSPAETAEARNDEDHEQDNAREMDWEGGW